MQTCALLEENDQYSRHEIKRLHVEMLKMRNAADKISMRDQREIDAMKIMEEQVK